MCISCTKGHFVTVWQIFLECSKSLFQGHSLPHRGRSSRMPSQHLSSPYVGCQAAENGRSTLASSSTADHGPWVSSTAGRLAWFASQVWLLRCFHSHGGPRVGSGDLEQRGGQYWFPFFQSTPHIDCHPASTPPLKVWVIQEVGGARNGSFPSSFPPTIPPSCLALRPEVKLLFGKWR